MAALHTAAILPELSQKSFLLVFKNLNKRLE